MLGELMKAIKLRWSAKSLSTSFPGGIEASQTQPSTTFPNVTVDIIGSSMTNRSTSSTDNRFNQYETATVDLTVHSKGGFSATSALAEILKAALDNAPLTLGGGVTLKKFWYMGESVDQDPQRTNFWDWTLTYQAVLEQQKTLVPA